MGGDYATPPPMAQIEREALPSRAGPGADQPVP